MHKMRAAVLILFLASSLAFGGCLMRQRTGKDGKGPEISMDNSEISVSIHADEAELLSGVTAYDAKDGDVTDSLAVEHMSNFIEKGRRKISIVAFDSDNNVTHAEREMVYNDYTSPVFSLDGPLRFSVNADDLTEGLSAEDCLDGTITDRIRLSYQDEISSTPGLYQVTYSAANRAGDVTSLPVTVELYDPAIADGVGHRLEGAFNRLNVAAAMAVGRYFGVDEERIRDAVAAYRPDNNRSQRRSTARNTLVVDCYNANPSSMQASLANFLGEESEIGRAHV